METTINAMKGKICDIMTVVVVTVDMQDTVSRPGNRGGHLV